jgi:putative FmdB family regulatory protein
MPHYDYQCKGCGKIFEEFQKITEKPLENCVECGGSLKRLIGGGGGIIFKGSGFYKTDYAKPSAACGNDTPACASCPAKSAAE